MRSPYGPTHTRLLHAVRNELVPVGFHGSQGSARPGERWAPGCASPFQYSRWTRRTLCLCVPSWSVRVVLRTSPAGQPSLILHVCHRRQKFRSVCHSLAHTRERDGSRPDGIRRDPTPRLPCVSNWRRLRPPRTTAYPTRYPRPPRTVSSLKHVHTLACPPVRTDHLPHFASLDTLYHS